VESPNPSLSVHVSIKGPFKFAQTVPKWDLHVHQLNLDLGSQGRKKVSTGIDTSVD